MINVQTVQPKVSIVTVAFNSGRTIARTIESVLKQTYDKIEYIIVDGLSQDDTVSIARAYAGAFAEKGYEYRIISEKDEGIYDAMNKGVAASTGDIVGLINSDDWYEPIAAETAAKRYEQEPYDMMYADLRIWKPSGEMIKRARNRRLLTTRDWNHPTTFIARDVYRKYQYSNETIYSDWELVLRLRGDGAKIAVVNKILANFSFGGVSNEKSFKKAMRRVGIRYGIYRKLGLSPLYWIDCFAVEMAKYMLG